MKSFWILPLSTAFAIVAATLPIRVAADIEATVRYEIRDLGDLDEATLAEANSFIADSISQEGLEGNVSVTQGNSGEFFATIRFEQGSCVDIQRATAEANNALGGSGSAQLIDCREVGSLEALSQIRSTLKDSLELGGQWYWSDWLGSFFGRYFPWIYTTHSGWIYTEGNDDSLFGYLPDNGWIWTADGVWPYAYNFQRSEWERVE